MAVSLIAILAGAISFPRLQLAMAAAAEAEAIGDTRRVVAAEQTFASANCGFFDDLPNLCRDGDECNGISIPDYPADDPEFIGGELGRRSPYTKSAYLRSFESDSLPTAQRPDPARCSPTSVLDYCYVSWPAMTGWAAQFGFAGTRSFAATPRFPIHGSTPSDSAGWSGVWGEPGWPCSHEFDGIFVDPKGERFVCPIVFSCGYVE